MNNADGYCRGCAVDPNMNIVSCRTCGRRFAIHVSQGGSLCHRCAINAAMGSRTAAPRPSPAQPSAAHATKKGRNPLWLVALAGVILAGAWRLWGSHEPPPRDVGFETSAAMPAGPPTVRYTWVHDLCFPWWQPVCFEGYPVWLEKGDLLAVTVAEGTPFEYGTTDSRRAFGHSGLSLVSKTPKSMRPAFLNPAPDARLLALQGRVDPSVNLQIDQRVDGAELWSERTREITRDGFLYVAPNMPWTEYPKWECRGAAEIQIEIHATDGNIRPAPGVTVPRPALAVKAASANLREEPSQQSTRVGRAHAGIQLTYRGQRGSWLHVVAHLDAETDVEGWIHRSLVKDQGMILAGRFDPPSATP
jgi:hypothetical protein